MMRVAKSRVDFDITCGVVNSKIQRLRADWNSKEILYNKAEKY